MTALAEVEHSVVPTAQYHLGRYAVLRAEVHKLNIAVQRKNRRNKRLTAELRKAHALLDINGIEWK